MYTYFRIKIQSQRSLPQQLHLELSSRSSKLFIYSGILSNIALYFSTQGFQNPNISYPMKFCLNFWELGKCFSFRFSSMLNVQQELFSSIYLKTTCHMASWILKIIITFIKRNFNHISPLFCSLQIFQYISPCNLSWPLIFSSIICMHMWYIHKYVYIHSHRHK